MMGYAVFWSMLSHLQTADSFGFWSLMAVFVVVGPSLLFFRLALGLASRARQGVRGPLEGLLLADASAAATCGAFGLLPFGPFMGELALFMLFFTTAGVFALSGLYVLAVVALRAIPAGEAS